MVPPALAAQFAKPVVKWGALAGGTALLLLATWVHGCATGKKIIQHEWDAAIAAQSAQAVREAAKAQAMTAQVVKANDAAARQIQAQVEQIKKKVVRHAKQNPKPLPPVVVSLYDELIRVPNEAGDRLSAPDAGAGTPEIPRGGVAIEAAPRLSLDLPDGDAVELTTDELAQAAVDFAEKYALLKNAYKGLSDWNDGRERLELERFTQD